MYLHSDSAHPFFATHPSISPTESLLETALPAINHQIRAIDITPRLARQQDHRSRQLLRRAHPPHRIPFAPRPPRNLQTLPLVQDRIHVARRDGVDADAVDGPFGSQRGFEADERGFGGVVRGLRLWVVDALGGDGGDQDDGAGEVEGDLCPTRFQKRERAE